MNKRVQDLVIPAELNRDPRFIEWRKTREFDVWSYLHSYTVRSPNMNTGGLPLYEMYKSGKVVSRWSQEDLANFFGTSQSHISNLLKSMANKGIIKKIYMQRGQSRILVYDLGTHDGKGNENLYAINYFVKLRGFHGVVKHLREVSK